MENNSFGALFDSQAENQRMMFERGMYGFVDNPEVDGKYTELPIDEPKLASYHI